METKLSPVEAAKKAADAAKATHEHAQAALKAAQEADQPGSAEQAWYEEDLARFNAAGDALAKAGATVKVGGSTPPKLNPDGSLAPEGAKS